MLLIFDFRFLNIKILKSGPLLIVFFLFLWVPGTKPFQFENYAKQDIREQGKSTSNMHSTGVNVVNARG